VLFWAASLEPPARSLLTHGPSVTQPVSQQRLRPQEVQARDQRMNEINEHLVSAFLSDVPEERVDSINLRYNILSP
jgi:hypothetical protein